MSGSRLSRSLAGLLTYGCVAACSFWFASIRYVGLNDANYYAAVAAFYLLIAVAALRCWRQGSLKLFAIVGLACVALGELPWRLNSRGHLNWLWSSLDTFPNDAQKIAAFFCFEMTQWLIGVTVMATAVEALQAWRLEATS